MTSHKAINTSYITWFVTCVIQHVIFDCAKSLNVTVIYHISAMKHILDHENIKSKAMY